MADIKTKDSIKGTIRTLDKAAIAGQRMKQAYVQTKEKAEHSTHAQENSAEEYASNRVEGGADRLTHEAALVLCQVLVQIKSGKFFKSVSLC